MHPDMIIQEQLMNKALDCLSAMRRMESIVRQFGPDQHINKRMDELQAEYLKTIMKLGDSIFQLA